MNLYRLFLIFIISFILHGCKSKPQLGLNYEPGMLASTKVLEKPSVTAPKDVAKQSEKKLLVRQDRKGNEMLSLKPPEIMTWEKFDGGPPSSIDSNSTFEEIQDRRWTPIRFAYNQSFLGESERKKIERLADYLVRNDQYHLIIEGHCDERGSEEYNRALGEKRAIQIKDYLVDLEVDSSRIKTISYGEERPLDPGLNEDAYAQNRRAELIVGVHLESE